MLVFAGTFNPHAARIGRPCIADVSTREIDSQAPRGACEVKQASSEYRLAGRVNCGCFNVSVFHRSVVRCVVQLRRT